MKRNTKTTEKSSGHGSPSITSGTNQRFRKGTGSAKPMSKRGTATGNYRGIR